MENEYAVDTSKFFSKSKNSPFNGRKLKGEISAVIVGGTLKFKDGKIL